jgi:hypothetical protein
MNQRKAFMFYRRLISSSLVVTLLVASLFYLPHPKAQSIEIDSSASRWAVPELKMAYSYGLTYPDIMKDFKKSITREEFCVIVVKLYEKLSQKKAIPGPNPFSDTSNPEIIKAYTLGIVQGVGAGKFAPQQNITRQEICVMIFRALSKAKESLDKTIEGNFPFDDTKLIAPWALEAMKFAYMHGIMSGVGRGRIDPLSNTTREQGIVLVKRTYEAFIVNSLDGTIVLGSSRIPPITMERIKFSNMDFVNRLRHPPYKTSLSLYVSHQPGKPDKLPGVAGSAYTTANNSLLINSKGNQKCWFSCVFGRGVQANSIVWQVSQVPFIGFPENWQNPPGLLAKGTVPATEKEFAIDFASIWPRSRNVGIIDLFPRLPRTRTQQTLYVRAVPVDLQGKPIGDPGTGISVLYGQPLPPPSVFSQKNSATFELLTTQRDGEPSSRGEFPNLMKLLPEIGIEVDTRSPRWFMFQKQIAETHAVWIQVSKDPFSENPSQWQTPKGLQYSKAYDKLPVSLHSYGNNCVPVPFIDFAPPKSDFKVGEYIDYYVRAVALRPSNHVGSEDVSFSNSVKVRYKYSTPVEFYKTETVVVKSYIPSVKIIGYQPIKWEASDWASRYVVFRAPLWNEVNCKWRNVNTGQLLYPYHFYSMPNSPVYDVSMTTTKYEKEIIPSVLKTGTTVHFVVKEENKSWWGQLWDGIVNFFKSLYNIVKELVNKIQKAYADLKNGLTMWIAQNLPGIPDKWRDELKLALDALVNSGLAFLGIPPTLPNFDDLTNMSLDYLTEVACAQAGIPLDGLGAEVINKTKEAIKGGIEKAANASAPNPIESPFLKNDPDFLYRPAYIDVLVSNNYDKPSLPTSLNLDVEWEWKESITLVYDTWAHLPIQQQYADALKYYTHFVYGLKRGHSGYPVYYPVYQPVRGLVVPSLAPGKSTVIRVYLEEFTQGVYPFAPQGDSLQWRDFAHIYWGDLGPVEFSVYTDRLDLPDPRDAALAQGYKEKPKTIYTYTYDIPYRSWFAFKNPSSTPWKP